MEEKEVKFEDLGTPPIQAFPDETEPGMTLRDYFAAKAMAIVGFNKALSYQERINDFAAKSYEIADAMLAERSK